MMALIAALAHGLPGADSSPSQHYLDQRIRERLQADEQIEILGDPAEPAPGQGLAPPGTPGVGQPGMRPPQRPTRYVRDYRVIALAEAKAAGIRKPKLFVRQMAAESGFQPCARSGAGALGIAQIMPATARSWRVDPFRPEMALRVAAQKMARYEKQYGSYAVALAAYNAGPGAVRAHGGVPPYPETRTYIRRVMNRREPLRGMQQVFRLPAGLHPKMRKRLYLLQKAVRSRGGKVYITDGWRSYDDQLRLWTAAKRKYGGFNGARRWVAPPGCSNHGRGLAADMGGNLALAHQLAPQFGLVFPMPHEPWHVELAGIPSQSG